MKEKDNLKIDNETLWRVSDELDDKVVQYVVPKTERTNVIESQHTSITSGHFKFDKTLERVKSRFFWPKYYSDVKKFIQECIMCQRTSNPLRNTKVPLKPILSNKPLEILTTDILGPLKVSKNGYKYILVIIDHFTKWLELYGMKNIDAKSTARCLLDFICRYGLPGAILSDQAKNYQSKLLEELWELLDIKRLRTTPFNPRCDGLSERVNRVMKRMITCYVNKTHDDWDELLPLLTLAYNSAVHSTTKYTPYELMFGHKPKMPIDLIYQTPQINLKFDPDGYAEKIKETLKIAHERVRRNRDVKMLKAKLVHDRQVMAAPFKKGDAVWLKNDDTKKGQCKKFIYKWKGLYLVTDKINDVNYIVKPLYKKGRGITVNRSRLKRHFYKLDEEQELTEPTVQKTSKVKINSKISHARKLVKRAKKNKVRRGTSVEVTLPEMVIDVNMDQPAPAIIDSPTTSNLDPVNIPEDKLDDPSDPSFHKKISSDIYAPDRPRRQRKPPDRYDASRK